MARDHARMRTSHPADHVGVSIPQLTGLPAAVGGKQTDLPAFVHPHKTALQPLVRTARHAVSKFGQPFFP